MAIATEAGFGEDQVAFVTAYSDRDAGAFKGSVSELAWRSFARVMSEPDHIMVLHRGADTDQVLLVDARLIAALGHPPRPLVVSTG